ncbi:PRC-barrel domain-containing protein [Caballeronia sp. S22]|uniref:PRC-barrel domain-containing protein n=1 Tax=Caballeronia sp. S22 TaxID=3137182 RepID=UPI0035317BF2
MSADDVNLSRAGANVLGGEIGGGPGPEITVAATLAGISVHSAEGEEIGKVSDIMLEVRSGRIAYAILSEGGLPGVRPKLHAIPWSDSAVGDIALALIVAIVLAPLAHWTCLMSANKGILFDC